MTIYSIILYLLYNYTYIITIILCLLLLMLLVTPLAVFRRIFLLV